MLLTLQSLFLLLLPLCHEVVANTEIINFSPSREQMVDLPLPVVGNWSKINHSDNERQWTLEPAALHTPLHQVCEEDATSSVSFDRPFACPHELWLFLDLDDEIWASYSTFTLRLSWAASTPADFLIEIYSPDTLLARLSNHHQISTEPKHTQTSIKPSLHPTWAATRSKYARIRAVNAGIPTSNHYSRSRPFDASSSIPHPGSAASANVAVQHSDSPTTPIPFIVILEPLYLGVLPASLLQTVGFLIPILVMATWSVSRVIAYFDTFVRQAREDLNSRSRLALEKKGR